MSSDWGQPVHKSHPSAASAGEYSVDSMTIIVRNPEAWSAEWEQVDRVCRTGHGCSGDQLVGRRAIITLFHNLAVLTGTTGLLEPLKDRR